MKLSVEVTGVQERQLADEAERLNVPMDELAAAAVQDLLAQRDADFRQAAARVLEKNRELYRRLA
jgi:hypothetical protein